MRRLFPCVLAALSMVLGCPPAREETTDVGPVVDAGATVDLAVSQDRMVPISPGVQDHSVTATTGTVAQSRPDCPGGPPWVGRPPCVRDGAVYAAASVRGASASQSLGRQQAVLAGRQRLLAALGREDGLLEHSEILALAQCADGLHALARAPLPADAQPRMPECGPEVAPEVQGLKGCPDWTARVVWREGDKVYAVGSIVLPNRALARAAATNRARARIAAYYRTQLEKTGGGVRQRALGSAGGAVMKRAVCAGATWALVEAPAPNGD